VDNKVRRWVSKEVFGRLEAGREAGEDHDRDCIYPGYKGGEFEISITRGGKAMKTRGPEQGRGVQTGVFGWSGLVKNYGNGARARILARPCAKSLGRV